jgi:hypothetical protein
MVMNKSEMRSLKVKTVLEMLTTKFNAEIEDNGDGILRIVTPVGINHKKIIDIGAVDYDTGLVSLNSFNISNFAGTSLKIFAIPRNKDIESVQNVILNVIEPDIDITIEQIRE